MARRLNSAGNRILFITGTDTGIGKTLLAALLLMHLRSAGVKALAMKPFCSGSRADVKILDAVQEHELPLDWLNPFYFPEPVAPLLSGRKHRRRISLSQAVGSIERCKSLCEVLIVEGSGGLLVPLGEGFVVADLIQRLNCQVIIATANKLGVINHTLLTVNILARFRPDRVKIGLMGCQSQDASVPGNQAVLRELLAPIPVWRLPYLGPGALAKTALKEHAKKLKKTLARLADFDSFSPCSTNRGRWRI